MSGLSIIYMNFDRANAQAEELSCLARDLRSINGDYEDCLLRIRAYWTGDNSKAFLEKADSVKNKVDKTASKADSAAQTISDIAEQTKNAELEAMELL